MVPVANGFSRVRVIANSGFFAFRAGAFGVVNPGDVADIATNDAKMLKSHGKVEIIQATDADPKIATDYLPERKKDKNRGLSPADKQVALLTEAVNSLKGALEAQGEFLRSLAANGSKDAKTK